MIPLRPRVQERVEHAETNALNFFTPYRRLEPNHENQLTRALLAILRLSPMAHTAWLRLDPSSCVGVFGWLG